MSKKYCSRIVTDIHSGEVFTVKEKDLKPYKEGEKLSPCLESEKESSMLSETTTYIVSSDNMEGEKRGKKRTQQVIWMQTYINQSVAKVSSTELTARELKLWMIIPMFTKWGNYATCTLDDLAGMLNTDRANISRAVSTLESNDMLIRLDRGKIRLNPSLVWVGDLSEQRAAVASYYQQKATLDAAKAKAAKDKARKVAQVAKRRAAIKLVK